jgi:hypothetical protein
MLTSIRNGMNNTFTCDMATVEALRALTRALRVASSGRTTAHIEQALVCESNKVGWLPLLCRSLVSQEQRERDAAYECLVEAHSSAVIQSLDAEAVADCITNSIVSAKAFYSEHSEGADANMQDTKESLLQRVAGMVVACSQDKEAQNVGRDGLRAWGALCELGGHKLVKSSSINDFLKIMENAFSMRSVDVCAWRRAHVYV